MTQVPTVLLISLIVIVYTIISHLMNWWVRILNKMDEHGSMAGLWVFSGFIYVIVIWVSIMLLSNLIVLTP